jgi:hypothetical protein
LDFGDGQGMMKKRFSSDGSAGSQSINALYLLCGHFGITNVSKEMRTSLFKSSFEVLLNGRRFQLQKLKLESVT